MPAKTVYEGYKTIKQKFIVNMAGMFQASLYYGDRKIIPSSAVLSIYRPSSGVKLIDGMLMTIGVDGVMSCPITVTDNALVGEDYHAVIAYVYDGHKSYITLFCDVVKPIGDKK